MTISTDIRFDTKRVTNARLTASPAERIAVSLAAAARRRRGVRGFVVVTMVWQQAGRSRFLVVGPGACLSGGAPVNPHAALITGACAGTA